MKGVYEKPLYEKLFNPKWQATRKECEGKTSDLEYLRLVFTSDGVVVGVVVGVIRELMT